MTSTAPLLLELDRVDDQVKESKRKIEIGIDTLEDEMKNREGKRKQILLREMKQLLTRLNEMDKKISQDLKGEAFDYMRALSKISIKVSNLKQKVSEEGPAKNTSDLNAEVRRLSFEASEAQTSEFIECLDISVAYHPRSMCVAVDRIPDAISLQTPRLSAKNFSLEVGQESSKYIDIRVVNRDYDPESTFKNLPLQKLVMITLMSQTESDGVNVIEESSLWNKATNKQATISDDGSQMVIQMKKPSNTLFVIMKVSLLGSNILNSPVYHKFVDIDAANQTVAYDTFAYFDTTRFDMTGNSMEQLKSNVVENQHCLSAATYPIQLNGNDAKSCSDVPDSFNLHENLQQSLSFSPRSEGRVSTLKATIGPVLNECLKKLSASKDSTFMNKATNKMVNTHKMISYDGGAKEEKCEKKTNENDKTVRFSPIAKLKNGTDGDISELKVGYVQAVGSKVQEGPNVMGMKSDLLTECNVNGNKDEAAPSQNHLARSNESIWECHGEEIYDYSEDPHLDLNESKAPPKDLDWSAYDPSWDMNSSLLPESCFDSLKILKSSNPMDMNHTTWDDTVDRNDHFNFLHGKFNVEDIVEPGMGHNADCLLSPHSIAHLPNLNFFLVSEPDYDRIGVYYDDTFKFKNWLKYPKYDFRKNHQYSFKYPTNILCFVSGEVAIIEWNGIHVLDRFLRPRQYIHGEYYGLAELSWREMISISKEKGLYIIVKFSKGKTGYFMTKRVSQVPITVNQDFENWRLFSKPKFLTVYNNKIFVSDSGLQKIYTIDLTTGAQSAFGYFGPNPGQFRWPTGMVLDDAGNLIVCDGGNNQLQVFSYDRKYVKLAGEIGYRFVSPCGVCRVQNDIYVAFRGGKFGAVVKYKVN